MKERSRREARATAGSGALGGMLAATLTWIAGAGEVPFEPIPVDTSIGVVDLAVDDLDGDGDPDVVVAGGADGLAWQENLDARPPVYVERGITTSAGESFGSVALADVNGDGSVDVVAGGDGSVWWYENQGAGAAFTERMIDPVDGADVVAVDVDGDGDVDVVAGALHPGGAAVIWYENVGGNPVVFARHDIGDCDDGVREIVACDVDGDGDVDVVAATRCQERIVWYEQTGGIGPSFTERLVGISPSAISELAATDVDRDGDRDLVVGASGGFVVWYSSNGAQPPAFAANPVPVAVGVSDVVPTDIDRDGHVDLLVTTAGAVSWLENDGSRPPVFAARPVDAGGGGASVFAVDVDVDGDLDVVGGSLRVYRSDAVPPACAADFGENGAVDVADIVQLLSRWGPCPGCPEDLSGNDVVDVADIVELLAQWGACGPSNDACANAIDLIPGATRFRNVTATTDGPPLLAACDEGAGVGLAADVWYRYVPRRTGTLVVSTCNDVDFDSRLAAYVGSCGALTLIACNDDGAGCAGFSSRMPVDVVAGEPVIIRVGSFDGFGFETGGGILSVREEP